MKKLFFFLLLIPLYSIAQEPPNCDKIVYLLYDKFTGKKTASNKIIVKQNRDSVGLEIFIDCMNGKNEYNSLALSFKLKNKKFCTDYNDVITILFTDSTRIFCTNISHFECESEYLILLGELTTINGKFKIEELVKKTIEGIRFSSAKSTIDFGISQEDAIILRDNIYCFESYLKAHP
jgi:hypothetical protein